MCVLSDTVNDEGTWTRTSPPWRPVNPVPVNVTELPPRSGPCDGAIDVIVGAGM
jgi:hypothetical protein